ncbi:hypothetical protein SAMN06295960_3333 [Paenibacillus aquistagni]|uniref:Uncharacterized protein n=1 Tax=Paenibacillus aquistagni TaxID=1852522 RepID=A0A1X7LE95_9BACL|nr:hypothetical protein SAMN06295960_3333 [Paenibacillus aquistagni]
MLYKDCTSSASDENVIDILGRLGQKWRMLKGTLLSWPFLMPICDSQNF